MENYWDLIYHILQHFAKQTSVYFYIIRCIEVSFVWVIVTLLEYRINFIITRVTSIAWQHVEAGAYLG